MNIKEDPILIDFLESKDNNDYMRNLHKGIETTRLIKRYILNLFLNQYITDR